MHKTMDDLYFDWLLKTILPAPNGKYYNKLMQTLYSTEFVPIIPMDDNRACDGLSLREHFSEGYTNSRNCTVLEMLIALAGRFEGNSGFDQDDAYNNFWTMIQHLGLDRYSDNRYSDYEVRRILYIFTNRTYDFNGRGGLFPLKKPKKDQRKSEIWEQMQAWEIEQYGI